MNEVDRTQKETKDVEKENQNYQRTVNVLQGGLQRIFDLLNIQPDGAWENEALTHKRGQALHRIGMLEYRAFELTQANLATIASQHLPQGAGHQIKDKFEAPDLLLPSLQKPIPVQNLDAHGGEDEDDQDYGEEYDDTRTFTVKDFKEQALRYAKDHYNTTGQINATSLSDVHTATSLKH